MLGVLKRRGVYEIDESRAHFPHYSAFSFGHLTRPASSIGVPRSGTMAFAAKTGNRPTAVVAAACVKATKHHNANNHRTFKIKMVEPIRLTTPDQREAILRKAHYQPVSNTAPTMS